MTDAVTHADAARPRPSSDAERWRGHRPRLHAGRRRAAARLASASSTRSPSSGAERLWELLHTEDYVHALGALTGNQAVQQVQRRPQGDLPLRLAGRGRRQPRRADVPRPEPLPGEQRPAASCERINQALQRADQIEHAEGKRDRYWFAPIVADAEAGFGGPLNAFELMKAMIEAGAAGVHFEDQLASEKKCGHLGGKVLVPTQPVHPHAHRGAPRGRRAATCRRSSSRAPTPTAPSSSPATSTSATGRSSPASARAEGFFRIKRRPRDGHRARPRLRAVRRPGLVRDLDARPRRGAARSPRAIHAQFPGKLLAYNCSPSFNWKKNLDDATIAKFQRELGAMGYKFQFVTLAGFHALNHGMFELARELPRRAAWRPTRELQQAEFAAEKRRLHRDAPPARGRHRLLRRGRRR